MEEYKMYKFKVELVGMGDNPEEAWRDAVECFSIDPGEYETAEEIEDEG